MLHWCKGGYRVESSSVEESIADRVLENITLVPQFLPLVLQCTLQSRTHGFVNRFGVAESMRLCCFNTVSTSDCSGQ